MSKPELSLCMIVRDEEEMLPDFLQSVSGLWDEFIAVDTGSSDRSADMLAQAGAQVIQHEWKDDFSEARNASLASATGRWILFLDADERVSPALAKQIRDLLSDQQAGAATVLMRNEIPGGQYRLAPLLRLFRNDPTIAFEHRIHEDPSSSVQALLDRENLKMHHLDGVVDHLGYVREVAADRNKKKRDLALLNQSLEQDSEDFYCWFKILEIARFWEDSQLWAETALNAARQVDSASPPALAALRNKHWGGEFLALISQGLFDSPDQALDWLDNHAGLIMPSPAWHLRRGFNLEAGARHDEAEAAYQECLALARRDPSGQSCIRPLLGLCRLAAGKGNLEQAGEFSREAFLLGPLDPEALLALAVFQPASNNNTVLRELLASHPESTVLLARAQMETGQVPLAATFLESMSSDDPEAALGMLVCTLVMGQDIDIQVDVEQEEADRLFKGWIRTLIKSKHADSIASFVKNSGAVVEIFPWLPEFFEKAWKENAG